jgi:hypothetical protein
VHVVEGPGQAEALVAQRDHLVPAGDRHLAPLLAAPAGRLPGVRAPSEWNGSRPDS